MAHRPQPDGPPVDYSQTKANTGYRPPPKWWTCDADRFIHVWLPMFESGALPKPTQAELDKLDLAGEEDHVAQRIETDLRN